MTHSAMMQPSQSRMLQDAAEAPEVVARMLARNAGVVHRLGEQLRARPPAFVATCARGSSDAAATYAKYLVELRLGTVVASVGPSVRSVYGTRPRLSAGLFLAISQSGQSPDLLSLAEAARADGAVTVAVVNDESSPLAGLCEWVLPLSAGPERSVAATKTWLASAAAVLQLVAHWSADPQLLRLLGDLPEELARAARADWSAAVPLLARAGNLFVIGRGPGFAAAQESALKLKETARLHAESYSAAELLHGPLALAGPGFPVLVYSQADAALPGISAVVERLASAGAPLAIAGPAGHPSAIPLPLAEHLHPLAAPLGAMQSFYPLAEAVARARGLDPDRPPHLRKVTETL